MVLKFLYASTHRKDGKLIPLSKRFDYRNPDMRYDEDLTRYTLNVQHKAEMAV